MTTSDPRLLHKVVEDCRDALSDLCDPLKRTIMREDINPTTGRVRGYTGVTRHVGLSLLEQLRDEVANSSNRGGRRKSSSSSPVGVDALDLWNTIATGALFLAAQTGAHIDGVDTEHVLRASVAATSLLADLEAALGVRLALQGWVKSIRTLLDPPKRVPLWTQACPVEDCGEETVWRLDESDGEVKRTAALEVSFAEDTLGQVVAKEARCLACGAEWGRQSLLFLARLLGRDFTGVDLSLFGVEDEGEPAA